MLAVAIVGSRGITDYEMFKVKMETLLIEWGPFVVVSGGARGVDSMAARWAKERGLALELCLPEWQKYGHRAGLERNHSIVAAAEVIVAFWDGTSTGTAHTVSLARKAGKRVVMA